LLPATLAFAENGVCKRKAKSTAGAGIPSLGNRLFCLKGAEGLAPVSVVIQEPYTLCAVRKMFIIALIAERMVDPNMVTAL